MLPQAIAEKCAQHNIPEGLVLLIFLLLAGHIVLVGYLCVGTKNKARKIKLQQRQLRAKKAE